MSIPSVQQSANEMDANVLPTHAAHIIPQLINAQISGEHEGGNNVWHYIKVVRNFYKLTDSNFFSIFMPLLSGPF